MAVDIVQLYRIRGSLGKPSSGGGRGWASNSGGDNDWEKRRRSFR